MSIRRIIREELIGLFKNDYPDFFDTQFNPQIGIYPPMKINNYGDMMKEGEGIRLDRDLEEPKPYKFYLICDKLCDLEGVEVKNKMIEDSQPVSKHEFLSNCAYSDSLLIYETMTHRSDPSMGFYKSLVNGVSCYYVQYAGFEFIFTKNTESGKEYWLEEMFDQDGNYIY